MFYKGDSGLDQTSLRVSVGPKEFNYSDPAKIIENIIQEEDTGTFKINTDRLLISSQKTEKGYYTKYEYIDSTTNVKYYTYLLVEFDENNYSSID